MEMECILPREVTCTKKCHAVDFFFFNFQEFTILSYLYLVTHQMFYHPIWVTTLQ